MAVVHVIASDGTQLPIDSLEQIPARDGNGKLSTITVQYEGKTYVQTYTYTNGVWSGTSKWMKQ